MIPFLAGLPVQLAALISVLISAVALVISLYNYLHITKPVLVLIRRPARTWTIKNIGRGAAFNISLRDNGVDGQKEEFKIYPIGDGGEVKLEKLKYGGTLEIYFTNVAGRRKYKTTCKMWEQDVKHLWCGRGFEKFSKAPDESRLHPDTEVPPATPPATK